MLKRVLPFLCLLAAAPAWAHDHCCCLEHHWMDIDYYRELRWQLAAFALLLVLYGFVRGFVWWKKRAA